MYVYYNTRSRVAYGVRDNRCVIVE